MKRFVIGIGMLMLCLAMGKDMAGAQELNPLGYVYSTVEDQPTYLNDIFAYGGWNGESYYVSGSYEVELGTNKELISEEGFPLLYDSDKEAYVKPIEAHFESSNEEVATCDDKRILSCKKAGNVTISLYLTYELSGQKVYVYSQKDYQILDNHFTATDLQSSWRNAYFYIGNSYEFQVDSLSEMVDKTKDNSGSSSVVDDEEEDMEEDAEDTAIINDNAVDSNKVKPTEVKLVSANPDVVEIPENSFILTVKGQGEATITLTYQYDFQKYTAYYTQTATISTREKSDYESDYRDMGEMRLLFGSSSQLTYMPEAIDNTLGREINYLKAYGYVEKVSPVIRGWSSDALDVVSVDANGIITAVGIGSATVSMNYSYTLNSSVKNYTAEWYIVVSNPQLVKDHLCLNIYNAYKYDGYYSVGSDLELTGLSSSSQVTAYSSSPDLAVSFYYDSISLRPKKTGVYTVTIDADGRILTATVEVVKMYFTRDKRSVGDTFGAKIPKKWREGYTMLALYRGEKVNLKLNGIPQGTAVSWTSSNPRVASVSSKGVVTAKKSGQATITASFGNFSLTYEVGVSSKYAIKAIRYAVTHYHSTYSQPKRMSKGYYDCSSYVWRSYHDAGYNLVNGGYAPTAAGMGQWCASKGYVISSKKHTMKVSKMLPGDLIFEIGENNGRYMGIYHVDFYVGNHCSMTVARSKFYGDTLYGVIVARPCK